MITHDLLANLIAQNGLESYAADLMRLSRSSVHIATTPAPDESKIPVGTSKFGGAPDVPAGFVWPHWGNKPLAFMGQIRLADVAPFDAEHLLPTSGWLHLFYDVMDQPWGAPDQHGSWQVFYTAESAVLTRLSPPGNALPLRALSFGQSWTIPVLADDHSDDSYTLFAHGSDQIMTVRAESVDDFDGLRNAVEASITPLHQLLGNPAQLQDDIRALCQYAANGIDTGAKDQDEKKLAQLAGGIGGWRLLLQIDSDRDSFGTTWGDSGCLYVCITSAALAARQFDKAWLVFQSD